MANIIIRKNSDRSWSRRKDFLHQRRKAIAEQIKFGLMTKSEMNRGNEGEPAFDKRVKNYDQWKRSKEPLMTEWGKINREFKQHKDEGKPQSIDAIRESVTSGKNVKYE